MVSAALPLADIQGNILRGYGTRYGAVRHLVLEIADPASARIALGALPVTGAEVVPARAGLSWCCNVGITFAGLAALGVPGSSLATFPPEFRAGMPARSARLGDVGTSHPSQWLPGLAAAERVHVLVSITGLTPGDIEAPSRAVLAATDAWRTVCDPLDGAALGPGDRRVHFGYLDGISQPRFAGIHDPDVYPDHEFSPLGTVLLGHPAALPNVRWTVPSPEVLGRNGAFNAFRVLEQDVASFEAYLASTSAATGLDPELVAARLCGRWRNGVPLALAPTRAEADGLAARPGELNDFGYLDRDPDGERCPIGAHVRRANPRDAVIVPRPGNQTRRVVRRGMPYGPPFRPDAPDGAARGLLGNFLCADLGAQFEALQGDWINLGLLHPRITGTNDALTGPAAWLDWTAPDGSPVPPPPQLVRTRGGAYCFVPSTPALRWIASLPSTPSRAP